jgi:hypothetical protein
MELQFMPNLYSCEIQTTSSSAERLPADERAAQREERLTEFGPSLIANGQATKAIEPG